MSHPDPGPPADAPSGGADPSSGPPSGQPAGPPPREAWQPGAPPPAVAPGPPPGPRPPQVYGQPPGAPAGPPPGSGPPAVADPRPGLLPHLIWEGVLLFLLVIVIAVAASRTPLFAGPVLWWNLGTLGLLASALALSLRLATPNLAVAGLATLSAAGYAWLISEASMPAPVAAAVVLVVMLVLGGVLGLIAGLGSVPAWALTLAVLLLSQGIALAIIGSPQGLPTDALADSAGFWAAVFILGSIAGGVVFAVPGVRAKLAGRLVADRSTDPVRFVPRRVLTALLGLGGSTLLAAVAGLASVSQLRFVVADFNSFNLFLALAAVLLGGVSVFGGKGGVAGTVLGTALVATVLTWLVLEAVSEPWVRSLVVAVLILLGLGVSRGLDALTGPRRPAALSPVPPPGPPPANYPPQWGPAPAPYR